MEELETLLKDAADTREANIYKEALVTMQELIHRKHLLTAEEILKVGGSHSYTGIDVGWTERKYSKEYFKFSCNHV